MKGLFREIHTPQSMGRLRRWEIPGYGVVSFYRAGYFYRLMSGRIILFGGRDGDFRELDHCPLFGLLWLLLVSHWVVFNSLRPRGLQHARLPCPPLFSAVCLKSCPLSQWCHPTISSSVIPFFSCPQSFPASGSFLISWPFASGGQSIGAST